MTWSDRERELLAHGWTEEALLARREFMAGERSRGLGDTVARIARATGLDRAAGVYTRITGRDCGCQARREALNRLVPYRGD